MAIDTRKYIQDPNNPTASIPNPSYGAILDGQYKTPPLIPTTPTAPITPKPTPGSGTYPEDLANSIQQTINQTTKAVSSLRDQQAALKQYGLTDTNQLKQSATGAWIPVTQSEEVEKTPSVPPPVVGTSDAERTAKRKEEIDKIKAELGGGATAPTVYKTAEDYDKLRKEQGLVKDEEELASIQNESALINEELRKYSSTAGEAVSEIGRVGAVSEAERNASFRLEGLAIRENAVINRLNSKNAYIGNMLKLGLQDYQTSLDDYNRQYAENSKAVELYNADLDNQKKDAMAGFSTITNLLKDKNIDINTLDPKLKSQIQTLELQSGLPEGTFEAFMTAYPDDNILSPVINEGADGSKTAYFFTQNSKTGQPKLIQTYPLSGAGNAPGTLPAGLLPTEQNNALVNAFNSAILGLPAITQKTATKTFQNYLSTGDTEAAKNYLLSVAIQGLPTDQQNQLVGRAVATDALGKIQELLGEARAKGADTNLFTGKLEYTANSLGTSTNPELAYIGSLLQQQFITYRRAMTGVAFSPVESSDYEKIFPSLIDVEKLSNAKIKALTDTFDIHNRANLSVYLGGSKNYDAIYGNKQQTENTMALDKLWQQTAGEEIPEPLKDPSWTERHPVLTGLYKWIFGK